MKSHKYSLDDFKLAIATSRSMRDALLKLNLHPTGGNYDGARKRIQHLGLDTSHWLGQGRAKDTVNPNQTNKPIEDYLVLNGPGISTYRLKCKLIQFNMLENKCYLCGIQEWQEKPIALHLDHINGNKYDNSLDNLRILCPNCHSQTCTYAGKNKGAYNS